MLGSKDELHILATTKQAGVLEIIVERSPLGLQMFPHSHDDRSEKRPQNGLFSPRNRLPRGTTWHAPYSPPICIPLMAQSPWKNNGPHWKHLRGRTMIVLSFPDDHSKKAATRRFLDTKLAIEDPRRIEMQQNLFGVMRLWCPVALNYLDAGFEPRCRCKDF